MAEQQSVIALLEDACYSPEELNTLLAEAQEEGRKKAIPDGWQVVPKETTDEMKQAGRNYFLDNYLDLFNSSIHYQLMLGASPKPEVKE